MKREHCLDRRFKSSYSLGNTNLSLYCKISMLEETILYLANYGLLTEKHKLHIYDCNCRAYL